MTKVYLTGEAGFHNLGDEGMALASAARIRTYFPDTQLISTSMDMLGSVLREQSKTVEWPLNPPQLIDPYRKRFVRKYGKKILGLSFPAQLPYNRPFDQIFEQHYKQDQAFRARVAEIEQVDFVFDMGHGGLNDVFNPFTLCFLYYLCGRLSRPLFISGQTIGPLRHRWSREMVREGLTHAHTIGLRDRRVSKQILLDEVQLDTSKVIVTEVGDDTLDLLPTEPDRSGFGRNIQNLLESGSFFAVQWRSSDYTKTVKSTAQLIPLIKLIQHIQQATGLAPLFVPFSWEAHSSDILVAARMANYIQDTFPFHVLWSYLNAPQLKWVVGRAKFGVGLSYHFNVFCLSQGVPTIGIYSNAYYRIKLSGVMALFEHTIPPLAFPEEMGSAKADAAIELVMNWTQQDKERLCAASERDRTKWHGAFQKFIDDNQL